MKDQKPLKLEDEFQTEMQLDIAGMHGRFKSRLIGVVNEEVLIFHITQKYADAMNRLTKGRDVSVTVRGISRGRAFGFKGACIKFIRHPKALMLLAYPTQIQTQTIRENHRVRCLLPGTFTWEETEINGVIADISLSGAHFKTQVDITEEQAAAMQLNNEVTTQFTLPGKDGAFSLKSVIRNTYMDDEKIDIGIQFLELGGDDKDSLQEFIDLSFDLEPF